MLCGVLRLPRGTYYKVFLSVPSNKEKLYNDFSENVKIEYNKSKGRYGAPKIQQSLIKRGIYCSLKRVQRYMKKLGLRSITVKKYRPEKTKAPTPNDKVNIISQDFKSDEINKKWVTDITYIHTIKDGWTYLASVIDLCSHKVIGYSFEKHMTAEMATKALKNACLNVENTEGIIIHSDLGSQYTSQEFEDFVVSKKMIHSYSRKGNPFDNACIESFHASLKKEEIYVNTYIDFQQINRSIFEYIESWYNRKRIHSSINYLTPQEKEDEFLNLI